MVILSRRFSQKKQYVKQNICQYRYHKHKYITILGGDKQKNNYPPCRITDITLKGLYLYWNIMLPSVKVFLYSVLALFNPLLSRFRETNLDQLVNPVPNHIIFQDLVSKPQRNTQPIPLSQMPPEPLLWSRSKCDKHTWPETPSMWLWGNHNDWYWKLWFWWWFGLIPQLDWAQCRKKYQGLVKTRHIYNTCEHE